ncbi:MAG TPA: SMC-Scp complex subunit ScpB [Firmicutes bacterium]|nr:SMC-Scp complex subunit ScpB [Bacillota bacterium]
MDIEKLDNVLESLLFLSGDALKTDDIATSLELQKSEIKKSVRRLKDKYGGKCGIQLLEFNGKLQFGTNPDYKEEVESVLNPIKERELSKATLETIAIIAYKQPVTKLEVETVRGVNCDYTMQTLLNLGMIEVVGLKDAIGHPKLYGTTDEFLRRFRLENINQLPDYESLLQSIEELEHRQIESDSLYNQFEIPAEEKPEFLAEGEGELVSSEPAPADVAATEASPENSDT